jgi:gliding motility-associated-like protein
MLKFSTLGVILHSTKQLVFVVICIVFPYFSFAQNFAFVNNGCNVYMQGTGNPNNNPTLSLHGSFLNLFDGITDGKIEQESGHIWIDSNWYNDANNNVFTNFSGSSTDGYVTFENSIDLQLIDGLSPTYFENIIFKNFRKQLNNNDNLTQGLLEIDAVLLLNENNFIINNPNPLSLVRKSGFIVSETLPGNYGTLQWNIGSGLGTYIVPFGSDNFKFDDLNLAIDVKTPIGPFDHISFATYPTDIYNNPIPLGSSILELEPHKVVDRFWIIEPSNQLFKPTADITFTYSSKDVASGYNSINDKTLKASRNNTVLGQWLDMQPRGSAALNTVKISDVKPSEFFAPWTLVNIPGPVANVFVPDAFTPDGNGLNDLFIPIFQVDFIVTEYELFIFDRWGIVQFTSTDPTQGWNGKKNNNEGAPINGVYTWLIIVKGYSSENEQNIELREKINGRVTLYN